MPTSWWRGVGPTHNVFVVESFIDELEAGWGSPLPKGRGRGVMVQFAFGSYVSIVAEMEGDGSMKVHRLVCAAGLRA